MYSLKDYLWAKKEVSKYPLDGMNSHALISSKTQQTLATGWGLFDQIKHDEELQEKNDIIDDYSVKMKKIARFSKRLQQSIDYGQELIDLAVANRDYKLLEAWEFAEPKKGPVTRSVVEPSHEKLQEVLTADTSIPYNLMTSNSKGNIWAKPTILERIKKQPGSSSHGGGLAYLIAGVDLIDPVKFRDTLEATKSGDKEALKRIGNPVLGQLRLRGRNIKALELKDV